MSDIKHRSLRKLIASRLPEIAAHAEDMTGISLDSQPEYFMSLKIAEAIHDHFKNYTFSVEAPLGDICRETGIDPSQAEKHFRVSGQGKADIAVRHSRRGKYRHIIECKRRVMNTNALLQDARRLAWLCTNVSCGHRVEKNFLVAITTISKKKLEERVDAISTMLHDEFDCISLKASYCDMDYLFSTRFPDKSLRGVVCEIYFDYK